MIIVNPTEKFALSHQAPDGNVTRFVEAIIFDSGGNIVNIIQLYHFSLGLYRRKTFIDLRGNYQAQIFVYDDTNRTTTLTRNLVTINIRLDDTLGPGAVLRTHTTCDINGDPISEVRVHVTSDILGKDRIAGVRLTDINGKVNFFLDEGTFYFWPAKVGFEFDVPDVEVFDDS